MYFNFKINVDDAQLKHINKVCTKCYQNIKTITYSIESITDIQTILKIENRIAVKQENPQLETIKRLKNLEVKKVVVRSSSFEQKEVKSYSGQKKQAILEGVLPTCSFKPEPESQSPPKKVRAFMCITCSEKFNDYEKLQSHLKSCQAKTDDLKCFCGKILISKQELEQHVQEMHQEYKRQHICVVCGRTFALLSNLENHMLAHKATSPKEVFVCKECKIKFNNYESLRKHRETKCLKKTNEL